MKTSKKMIFLFLAPAVIFYFFIFIYPTFRSIYLSFFTVTDFVGGTETFVGIQNYVDLTKAPLFIGSFKNLLLIWFVGGAAIFGLSFFFVVLLISGIRGKKFFRAVIYLPNVIAVVAMVTTWSQYIYNPKFGLFTTVFKNLGLDGLAKVQWTAPEMVFQGMMVAYVWGGVGYFLLIILAGVERIPMDYYEAARIDGANMISMFFQITLPLLKDVIRVSLVMWSITAINFFSFAQAWNPVATPRELYTPAIYMYNLVFGANTNTTSGSDIGRATAVGVSLLVLVLITSLVINRLMKQDNVEY